MDGIVTLTGTVRAEKEKAYLVTLYFWISGKSYYWTFWAPKKILKVITGGERFQVPEWFFRELKEDIRRNHSFHDVSYAFQYEEEKVTWAE